MTYGEHIICQMQIVIREQEIILARPQAVIQLKIISHPVICRRPVNNATLGLRKLIEQARIMPVSKYPCPDTLGVNKRIQDNNRLNRQIAPDGGQQSGENSSPGIHIKRNGQASHHCCGNTQALTQWRYSATHAYRSRQHLLQQSRQLSGIDNHLQNPALCGDTPRQRHFAESFEKVTNISVPTSERRYPPVDISTIWRADCLHQLDI